MYPVRASCGTAARRRPSTRKAVAGGHPPARARKPRFKRKKSLADNTARFTGSVRVLPRHVQLPRIGRVRTDDYAPRNGEPGFEREAWLASGASWEVVMEEVEREALE